MQQSSAEYQALVQRFYSAVNDGIMWGNASAMLALWSGRDDVSYCDPNGQVQRGRQELVAYWHRAEQVNSETRGSISATIDILAIQASAEMVSIVVREHIRIQEEDGNVLKRQALATTIFRRENQQWRVIHRHAGTPVEEV